MNRYDRIRDRAELAAECTRFQVMAEMAARERDAAIARANTAEEQCSMREQALDHLEGQRDAAIARANKLAEIVAANWNGAVSYAEVQQHREATAAALARAEKAEAERSASDLAYQAVEEACMRHQAEAARLREALNAIGHAEINATSAADALTQVVDLARSVLVFPTIAPAAEAPKTEKPNGQ